MTNHFESQKRGFVLVIVPMLARECEELPPSAGLLLPGGEDTVLQPLVPWMLRVAPFPRSLHCEF